jgi:uncharacterized protein HemX
MITLEVKIIIALVLALGIGGAYWTYQNKVHQIEVLKKDNKEKEKQIGNLNETLTKLTASKEIDTKIVTDLHKEQTVIETKVTTSTRTADAKINQIKRDFAVKPPTVENKLVEIDQISQVRIDTLWDVFCTADPGSTECPAPSSSTPQGAPT